jgi:hypothetical protein
MEAQTLLKSIKQPQISSPSGLTQQRHHYNYRFITATKRIECNHLNLKGEQVLTETFSNKNKIEMNISSLPKGAYLVKIRADEGMEVKKLVVE